MTVKELIEQLEDCPQNAIVQINHTYHDVVSVSVESLYNPGLPTECIVYLETN